MIRLLLSLKSYFTQDFPEKLFDNVHGKNFYAATELLTLNVNVSLKTGFKVFLWTFVSNFFFLSGIKNNLQYGSERKIGGRKEGVELE